MTRSILSALKVLVFKFDIFENHNFTIENNMFSEKVENLNFNTLYINRRGELLRKWSLYELKNIWHQKLSQRFFNDFIYTSQFSRRVFPAIHFSNKPSHIWLSTHHFPTYIVKSFSTFHGLKIDWWCFRPIIVSLKKVITENHVFLVVTQSLGHTMILYKQTFISNN